MPTLRSLPAIAALALALSACRGSQPAAVTSGAARTESRVTLVNQTGVAIERVYVSPCESSEWGGDELGGLPVASGDQRSFRLLAGCYDLRAVDRNGRESVERNVRVAGDGKRWTLQ